MRPNGFKLEPKVCTDYVQSEINHIPHNHQKESVVVTYNDFKITITFKQCLYDESQLFSRMKYQNYDFTVIYNIFRYRYTINFKHNTINVTLLFPIKNAMLVR